MPKPIEISAMEKYEVFKASWTFETSQDETIRELASLAVAIQFNKGELIFYEEDPCRFFYLIKEGRIKSFKQSVSGKHFAVTVNGPGDALSTVVLFSGNPYFLSAQAMDRVILFRVKRDEFVSIVRRDSNCLLQHITLMENVGRSNAERIIDLIGERAEQRVYNILYMLHKKFGKDLRFSSEEIAELSGTTAETVIRIFTGLKNLSIISSERRNIHILNSLELRNICRASEHTPGRI
jgi:CRP-like cAMP-binding protein